MGSFKIAKGGLKAERKARAAAMGDKTFKEAVDLGYDYRAFFRVTKIDCGEVDEFGNPILEDDLACARVPMRQGNFEKIKIANIRITDCEEDETGVVTDKSPLVGLGHICRVLHEAECKSEKAEAEERAKSTAAKLGENIDPVALSKELDNIQTKYFGKPAENGLPAVMPTIAPLLSGHRVKILAEAVIVRLDAKDGSPVLDKTFVTGIELNGKKCTKLLECMENASYYGYLPAEDGNGGYIEVAFAYKGATRQEAGRGADYNPISRDVSLSTQFPEQFKEIKAKFLNNLVDDPELIVRRHPTSRMAKDDYNLVIEEVKKYVANHRMILTYLDFESDAVKRTAKTFLDYKMADSAESIKVKLADIAKEQADENPADEKLDAGVAEVMGAKKIADLNMELVDSVVADEQDIAEL